MQTEIVSADSKTVIERVVELLQAGEVVALPTETVYGLAADAFNPVAVAKIFETKERPRFDPLIVHLPNREALHDVATADTQLVAGLIDRFWPGPLTVILPKRKRIPDIVTAGLGTVAVRMSANAVFAEIAARLARPLAAPSANRFGHISPTAASHVLDELGGRIPLIVDGGSAQHGLESTIVRIIDDQIEILRRGPITAEMLQEFAPISESISGNAIVAPGQLQSHYAPRTKLILVNALEDFSVPFGKRIGALHFASAVKTGQFSITRRLSERADLREAAANLFGMLRELDTQNLDLIVAELLPEDGLGAAINERLRRAASPR
ncbi:MAG: L-threonylcarbamoyladenylate synthase [Verrucomicrobiota bacterium]